MCHLFETRLIFVLITSDVSEKLYRSFKRNCHTGAASTNDKWVREVAPFLCLRIKVILSHITQSLQNNLSTTEDKITLTVHLTPLWSILIISVVRTVLYSFCHFLYWHYQTPSFLISPLNQSFTVHSIYNLSIDAVYIISFNTSNYGLFQNTIQYQLISGFKA